MITIQNCFHGSSWISHSPIEVPGRGGGVGRDFGVSLGDSLHPGLADGRMVVLWRNKNGG